MLGIAFILLVSGTLANSKSRKNCGISHHRQLSIGGILCFIHGLFAVAYYVSAAAVVREGRKPHLHEGQQNKPNQPHQHEGQENTPNQQEVPPSA